MKRSGNDQSEKVLILPSFTILLLVLGHSFLIVPYLQHGEWVKSRLELQPRLLTKNLRFTDRKEEIEPGLQSFKFNCTVVRMSPRQSEIPWINAFRGASTSGRPFKRRNLSKM